MEAFNCILNAANDVQLVHDAYLDRQVAIVITKNLIILVLAVTVVSLWYKLVKVAI